MPVKMHASAGTRMADSDPCAPAGLACKPEGAGVGLAPEDACWSNLSWMTAPPNTGLLIVVLLFEESGSKVALLTFGESTSVDPAGPTTEAVTVTLAVPLFATVPSEQLATPGVDEQVP